MIKGFGKTEWKSTALRAYQRRTKQADSLIAGAYLAGTNTRRVRRALAAVFGGAVSKDGTPNSVQLLLVLVGIFGEARNCSDETPAPIADRAGIGQSFETVAHQARN